MINKTIGSISDSSNRIEFEFIECVILVSMLASYQHLISEKSQTNFPISECYYQTEFPHLCLLFTDEITISFLNISHVLVIF